MAVRHLAFEPAVADDFPTVDAGTPRIPHIIHQTYVDENIPYKFSEFVKSFIRHNLDWKYYFWTDKSARRLIADRHPGLLATWDHYKKGINRADALRYVVLYEYGGVYVDLDFECLRPLHRVTMKYACMFPTEPFEHSVFRLNVPFLLTNAIILCRPKHPFLKQLIDSLPTYLPMAEQLDVAGPCFVTSQFMFYNKFKPGDYLQRNKIGNESSSPYFYKGRLREDDEEAVYVPNTHYFMHSLDQHAHSIDEYEKTCRHSRANTFLVLRACMAFRNRTLDKEDNRFTYTRHHWSQTYNTGSHGRQENIHALVPHCNIYRKGTMD